LIVGIHQPNYLPWLGYFRKISVCDVFVLFYSVQMPGGKSFVSRNAIKSRQGRQWLTVPTQGKLSGPISAATVADQHWPRKHLRTLEANYRGSEWMWIVEDVIAPIIKVEEANLAKINIQIIEAIAKLLDFDDVRFIKASELELSKFGTDKVHAILQATNATVYATGKGAGTIRYLNEVNLEEKGVAINWISPEFDEYEQQHGPFEERLSAIDALLNIGPEKTRSLILG